MGNKPSKGLCEQCDKTFHGFNDVNKAFCYSIRIGHSVCATTLIKCGADVNRQDVIFKFYLDL